MLFLRDIDADVQLRCLACGHGGVLPRAMLERRFGPNYPVLSIAPHYRCSRCDSRDIESRPILAAPQDAVPASTTDEPSFDAPLAALNGLLASLRGDGGADRRTADTEPPASPPPPPPAPASVRGKPVSELPLSDLVADGPGDGVAEPLWEPVSLADMAARLGRTPPPGDWPGDLPGDLDDEPPAREAKAPANDERPDPTRVDTSEDGDTEDGDDETLMAMRQLLAQAYGSDDDLDGEDDRHGGAPEPATDRAPSFADRHASIDDLAIDDFAGKSDPGHDGDEPPAFSHKVLVRRDFEDDWGDADAGTDPWRADSADDDPEDGFDDREPDGEEPSEEEILSFAIRDPEKLVPAFRPAKPEPPPAAEPLDFDQHRAERRAQRPPPPPEDEEGFDRTLAALRSMIEDAANEPAEEDAPSPPPKTARSTVQTAGKSTAKSVDRPARREEDGDPAPGRDEDEWSLPAGWGDPDPVPEPAAPEPDPAPAGRRSAQEREIEEAMKALRGLIEDEVQPDLPAPQPPPPQPKPRAGKPRPVRSGSGAPDAPPPAAPSEEAKPGGEPTPLSKTIAALRGMLELDGRRKR